MMWGLGYLVVCVTLAISVNCQEELLAVATIYRHGDRTPIYTYPTDPYDASYWPIGYGQLTNNGKNRAYKLGRWLRDRYDGFIPTCYNLSDIYVRSTDVDRCLQSAQSVLAGLYPARGNQIWNLRLLNWQPIPVHTVPEDGDPFAATSCPAVTNAAGVALQSEPFKSIWIESQPAVEIARNGSGQNLTDITEVLLLFDVLKAERLGGLQLPAWADQVYDDLNRLQGYAFAAMSWTEEQQKIVAGPTINEVLKHFDQALENSTENKQKVWMLSAHDANVASILGSLGLYDFQSPPYSATVIFELKSCRGTNYVDIVYKRDDQVDNLVLESCGERCTLEGFISATSNLVIDQAAWETLCSS